MKNLTHVLIRLSNGDEELVPVQHLAARKRVVQSGGKTKGFHYWAENCMNETNIPINAEQYDHLCSLVVDGGEL